LPLEKTVAASAAAAIYDHTQKNNRCRYRRLGALEQRFTWLKPLLNRDGMISGLI